MFFFSGNHFIKATYVYSFRVSYINQVISQFNFGHIHTSFTESEIEKKITLEFSDMIMPIISYYKIFSNSLHLIDIQYTHDNTSIHILG